MREDSADVVVIGAGAAGLSAALAAHAAGASVIVLEKGEKLGGTTAVSGGVVWAPMNPRMADSGLADSREAALAYFQSLDHGDIRPDMIATFVDEAGAALGFLESVSGLAFEALADYPDYYQGRPGAMTGGRSLDCGLFAFAELGDWAARVATNGAPIPVKLMETPTGGFTGTIDPAIIAERLKVDTRGFGQALLGHLLKACLDRAIEPRLATRATGFLRDGTRVAGVTISDPDGPMQLHARRGVVLATGGFEHDRALVTSFLKGPMTLPASPPGNTGDGLRLAMGAGAAIGNMKSAWWVPTIETTDRWPDGSQKPYLILYERTLPGSLIVNRAGKRFCNEAANYSALSGAFHAFDPNSYAYPNLPAWLVVDAGYRRRYPQVPAFQLAATVHQGDTLADLAASAGIDPAGLAAAVQRFNAHAESGADAEFQRGDNAYDRFYGDRSRPAALATLAPLAEPPFQAIQLHMGALGTNGGALTDVQARVLDHDGAPIPGLFAAGNCMAAPTGSVYAGAGGTLGPALTFGVIAGRTAARLVNAQEGIPA